MKRILLSLLFFILISWIGILYYVHLKTDLATSNINETTLKFSQGEYQYQPPISLVSYGAGDPIFLSNQITLAESALNKGIQNIYMYGRQNIDPEFYAKNKHILDQPRGAGYWLWKPYFILKTMNQLPDDSIILYADSGVIFSAPPADRLLDLLKENDMVFAGHGNPAKLRTLLKKEAQILMGIDKNEKILNSQEIWAYFIAIRNNVETREFINKWLAYCENIDILTDQPLDPNIQEEDFYAHLHDQSILSVLVAQNPEKKIVIKRYKFRKDYGLDNFHRHPQDKYTSPKFHSAGLQKKIADFLYNNSFLRIIREKMN